MCDLIAMIDWRLGTIDSSIKVPGVNNVDFLNLTPEEFRDKIKIYHEEGVLNMSKDRILIEDLYIHNQTIDIQVIDDDLYINYIDYNNTSHTYRYSIEDSDLFMVISSSNTKTNRGGLYDRK